MFLAECEVINAFCRNDDGLAEALLAAGTLQEILGGMPTFNTLAPEMATDANPPSAPQVEGTDETASYAAPDEPECDKALPAPPLRLRAPRSLVRRPHSVLVKVTRAFPDASSVELAARDLHGAPLRHVETAGEYTASPLCSDGRC